RGQVQFHVLPLTGGALAIEVREERIFLREQPADALAEPLAFQVPQVPDMLDQRERAAAHAHERLRHLRRDPRDDRGRPLQHLEDFHAPGIYHRRPQGVPSCRHPRQYFGATAKAPRISPIPFSGCPDLYSAHPRFACATVRVLYSGSRAALSSKGIASVNWLREM